MEKTSRTFVGADPDHGAFLDQVIDRDVTYLRIGGPDEAWEQAELGEPDEFAVSGDAGDFSTSSALR